MKVHFIPDTTALVKDYAGEGKVGIGVHEQRQVEKDRTKVKEVEPSEKTTNEPETNDLGVYLQFAVDKETGEHLVKVLDPDTGKILRQYPPEEFLQVVKNLRNLKGLLFSARS